MKKATLKNLRLVAPAVIFFTLLFVVAKVMGFAKIKPPANFKDALFSVPYLIVAVIYYVSPLRAWANGSFHKKVNENLRSKLVMHAGLADDLNRYTWARVKDVFYRRIDSDPSLKERSEDIMTNGLIWTSLADLTILSLLFFIGTVFLWIAGLDHAPEAAVILACVGLASRLLQDLVTTRHIEMGNDQIRYIAQFQRADLTNEMNTL